MVTEVGESFSLAGRGVFVSASIPDPGRWSGRFDALAITDAVVAVARTILARDGRIITAAHPTIAPLLLYVAAEQPQSAEPFVVVYQSEVFRDVWPPATLRFEAQRVGKVIRTPSVGEEPPDPRLAPQSLELMRTQLMRNERLVGAVFIGGMKGIRHEHHLFSNLCPDAPTYALGTPGGEAAKLVDSSPHDLQDMLASQAIYPAVARRIVADIARRQ